MQNINKVDFATATGATKELLSAINSKFGMIPNTFATMATSPTTLEAYLGLNGSLEGGKLPFETRNQIAILVSQLNGCSYCLSAFTAIGKGAGTNEEALHECRMAGSSDPKIQAALVLAKEIVQKRGAIAADSLNNTKSAGYSDEEIAEIIANVSMITFINYFNLVAGTEIDFPLISPDSI